MEKNIKNAGVSLIEVMISMVMVALLLMAIASIFPRMASHSKGMSDAELAKIIAEEELTKLQISSESDPCGANSPAATDDKIVDRGGVNYTVKAPEGCITDNDNGIKTYTVTVTWGKKHKIEVTGALK